MRINEITAIKPIKQLTPAKERINALKQQQTKAKTAFNAERERQQQAKATERIKKAQRGEVTLSDGAEVVLNYFWINGYYLQINIISRWTPLLSSF